MLCFFQQRPNIPSLVIFLDLTNWTDSIQKQWSELWVQENVKIITHEMIRTNLLHKLSFPVRSSNNTKLMLRLYFCGAKYFMSTLFRFTRLIKRNICSWFQTLCRIEKQNFWVEYLYFRYFWLLIWSSSQKQSYLRSPLIGVNWFQTSLTDAERCQKVQTLALKVTDVPCS